VVYAPQVSDILALVNVMFPFKLNAPVKPLHEGHIGTIFSPVTLGLMICAPSVGKLKHSLTEQVDGHALFANLIQ
jgi:hypothetical protein